MMRLVYTGARSCVGIGLTCLACLEAGVHRGEAQQIRIESVFPQQVPRGQSTVISVAIPSRDTVQAAEISPATGVKVSGVRRGENIQGTLTWLELSVDVAQDAAPGERSLVLLMQTGRTAPATITIPNHVPRISELRVVAAPSNQSPLELQFVAVDPSADLADAPYVWFTLGCAREHFPGVVYGKASGDASGSRVVRASVPNLFTAATGRTPPNGRCDLGVRVTDVGGIESNTLTTTVDIRN